MLLYFFQQIHGCTSVHNLSAVSFLSLSKLQFLNQFEIGLVNVKHIFVAFQLSYDTVKK